MIRRNDRHKQPRNEDDQVYLPSAAEIRRGAAEVQERWTARQRRRREIGTSRRLRVDVVSPRDAGERWTPGVI